MERGYPLPIRLRGLGSVVSDVRGGAGALAENGFGAFLCSTERISDRQRRQNDQLRFDQLLELQNILTLNRDKFGTGNS